jgi:hypothetical protein
MNPFNSGPKNANIIPKGKAIPRGYKLAFLTQDKFKATQGNVDWFNGKNYFSTLDGNTPVPLTAEINNNILDVYDKNKYLLWGFNPKFSIDSVMPILEEVPQKGGKSRKQKRGGRKSRKNRRSRKSM